MKLLHHPAEPQICCCGVKHASIIVAYIELVLCVLASSAICFTFRNSPTHTNQEGLENAMLGTVIGVSVVRTFIVLIGVILVHVGVMKVKYKLLYPFVVINAVLVFLLVINAISAGMRGLGQVIPGILIDMLLLGFFTYVVVKAAGFIKSHSNTTVTYQAGGQTIDTSLPPPYSA